MTERIVTDANGRKYITTEPWNTQAVLVEDAIQRMTAETMTDKEVMQQALEALESGPDVDPIFAGETITALREALEQPEQEPVAWVDGSSEWKDWCGRWFGPDADDDYLAKAVFDLPPMAQKFRYTALEQPEQRKPLTDEQARDLLPINHNHMTRADLMLWVLRATERAHNIKEGA